MFARKKILDQITILTLSMLLINVITMNGNSFVSYGINQLDIPEGYIELTQEQIESIATRAAPVAASFTDSESCFGMSINSTLAGHVTGGTPPYTYMIVRQPVAGTVSLTASTGAYTYTNSGLYPTVYKDVFYYQVTDSASQVSNVASVTRTVGYQALTGAARAVCPGVASAQTIFNNVNGSAQGTFPYTYYIVTLPTQGTIIQNSNFTANGQFTYTPNSPFQGTTDTLEFKLQDAVGCFSTNNGVVTFSATLTASTFNTSSICIGSTLSSSVSGRATGGTPPYSNYAIVSTTKQGILTPAANFSTSGNFTYIPNANFVGTGDSFTFTVKDSTGCVSAVGTCNIPLISFAAVSKTSTAICPGKSISVILSAAGGTAPYKSYQIVNQPAQGVVSPTASSGNNFTYTPNSIFLGTQDTFTYQVIDSVNCVSKLATITVPVGLQLATNTFNTCPGVSLNSVVSSVGTSPYTFTKRSNPSNGTVSLNTGTGQFTYVPNVGFLGPTDSFNYSLVDAKGCQSNVATVLITIGLAPIANFQTAGICGGGSISGAVNGVGSGGTAPYVYSLMSSTQNGTLTLNANFAQNGKYSYTSNTGFNGPSDSFSYKIVDNKGCTSNTATVTIPVGITTVNYNTQCICQNTSLTSSVNGVTLGGRPPFTYNVTGSGPLHGSLSLNSVSGAYTYTPFTGYTGPSDSFSYTVTDSASCMSGVATITIPVGFVLLPATIGPVAPGNTITSSLSNYVTRGEAPFTYAIVTPVSSQGTFTELSGFVNNGDFSYSPHIGFVGSSDSFTYMVTDNTGCVSNTVQVTILVS